MFQCFNVVTLHSSSLMQIIEFINYFQKFLFFFLNFYLKIIVFNIVLVSAIHQPIWQSIHVEHLYSHSYTYVPSLLKLIPIFHPIPPLQVVTVPWVELSVSHRNSHWLSMLPMVTYIFPCYFLSIPPSSFHTVFTSVFSMSVSPLLPCKQVHQYHLSRLHEHALIYNIYLSLSDFNSLCKIDSRFIYLIRTDSNMSFLKAE